MIAPLRVTPDLFNALVDTWYDEHAYNRGIRHTRDCAVKSTAFGGSCTCGAMIRYECKKCGAEIKLRMSWIAVHFGEWTDHCVGAGEVIHPALPYCPKCCPQDEIYGCIHTAGKKIPSVLPNIVSPKERVVVSPETRFKQLMWTLGIVVVGTILYQLFH